MTELFENQLFIQSIGVVALVFSLLVFQVNKRNQMLKLHLGASLLYAVHFYLLGAFCGASINLVNAVRNYTFFSIDRKKHGWLVPVLFILLFISVGLLTWQDWRSILPIISAISGTLAFWQRNPKWIRIFSLIVSPTWFLYAYLTGSYPMMLAEAIMFSSDIIGLFRYNYPIKFSQKEADLRHRKKLHP